MEENKKVTENDIKLYDALVEADRYLFMAVIMDKGYLNKSKIQTKIETVKGKVQHLRSEIFTELYYYTTENNEKLRQYNNLPQQVYIVHDTNLSYPYKAADFFVLGNYPFEKQGYDMHDCEYVKQFRLKFPVYRYVFSDDNAHVNGWNVDLTGWTDVTDWLKESD